MFIWKTVVDWNRIVRDIFHPRKIIHHRVVFSFSIDNLQIKFLKKEYPPNESWFGILFLHKILNGSMISMNNNFRINNILPKLITSKHHCQEFLLGSSIILLSNIKCFAGIMDDIQLLVNPLSQNSSNSKITSITHNFKGKIPVRWLYYRSGYQGFLKNFESLLTIFIKYKRSILLEKIGKGSQGLRKGLDKSSIETSMTKKTTNTSNVPWIGHPFNSFNFCLVHFNSPFGNLVSKNYPFVNHEVALLPIEHQIFFFTSLQNFIEIVETLVKGVSIDGKFIHENF